MSDEERRRSYDADIAEIMVMLKANNELTQKTHDTIHGNGSEGLKTKVGKLGVQVKLLFGFFVLTAGAAIKKLFFS